MAVDVDTPSGRQTALGNPIKLSDTPATVRTPPPGFGEHTDRILADLGYDAAAIADLRARGVV
jgi:formyl-CoA transferase/CoA:oxalate CoA-transferase